MPLLPLVSCVILDEHLDISGFWKKFLEFDGHEINGSYYC